MFSRSAARLTTAGLDSKNKGQSARKQSRIHDTELFQCCRIRAVLSQSLHESSQDSRHRAFSMLPPSGSVIAKPARKQSGFTTRSFFNAAALGQCYRKVWTKAVRIHDTELLAWRWLRTADVLVRRIGFVLWWFSTDVDVRRTKSTTARKKVTTSSHLT